MDKHVSDSLFVNRDGVVKMHIICSACGFDLYRMPLDRMCPECGNAIDQTIHHQKSVPSPTDWYTFGLPLAATILLAGLTSWDVLDLWSHAPSIFYRCGVLLLFVTMLIQIWRIVTLRTWTAIAGLLWMIAAFALALALGLGKIA